MAGHKKLYAIIRYAKDGMIEGFIDSSGTTMGWSREAVLLWKEKPPNHYCKPGKKSRLPDGAFIVRIHSTDCPIKVNVQDVWPARKRNRRFVMRPNLIREIRGE